MITPLSVLNVPDEYKLEGYDYYYQYPADILTLRGLHSSGSYDTNLEIKEVYIKEIDQRVILGTQEGLVAEGTETLKIGDLRVGNTSMSVYLLPNLICFTHYYPIPHGVASQQSSSMLHIAEQR